MELSVRFENTRGTSPDRGPVQIGWFLVEQKGGVIYFPPERVRSADVNRRHAKSASRCPASSRTWRARAWPRSPGF